MLPTVEQAPTISDPVAKTFAERISARVVLGGLFLGALWFLADAFVLFKSRIYPLWLTRCFLIGWNIMALGSAWWVWSTGALSRLR